MLQKLGPLGGRLASRRQPQQIQAVESVDRLVVRLPSHTEDRGREVLVSGHALVRSTGVESGSSHHQGHPCRGLVQQVFPEIDAVLTEQKPLSEVTMM